MTKLITSNVGATNAMISIASLQNSLLASNFTCQDADPETGEQNCLTYFQQMHNKTTTFACFSQSLQSQGVNSAPATTGGEVTFNISRVGDVLLGLTAVIQLPTRNAAAAHAQAWVANLGHHLINKCELLAQETVIEDFGNGNDSQGGIYGAFMDATMGMHLSGSKRTLYDNMIGNRQSIVNMATAPDAETQQIMCPLQFSFCLTSEYGLPVAPLPVCALAYCNLQVRLGLNSYDKVMYQYDSTAVGNLKIVPASVAPTGNYSVEMIAEYAMLSAEERSMLACKPTNQIVLHRQALSRSKTSASDTRTDINFSGCNSYWFSLFQNKGSSAGGTFTGFHSNYTTNPVVVGTVGPAGAVVPCPPLGTPTNPTANPITSIKINADSSPIIDVQSSITQWYNYWWKTGSDSCAGIETGHNLVPFCLTTDYSSIEAHGGFINLSKLTNVSEEVGYDTGLNGPFQAKYLGDPAVTAGAKQEYIHYILSVSYNIIIIDGGTLTHPYF